MAEECERLDEQQAQAAHDPPQRPRARAAEGETVRPDGLPGLEAFAALAGRGRASDNIRAVVLAARDGGAGAVIAASDRVVWGWVPDAGEDVQCRIKRESRHYHLLDYLATHVMRNSGTALIIPAELVAGEGRGAAVLLRDWLSETANRRQHIASGSVTMPLGSGSRQWATSVLAMALAVPTCMTGCTDDGQAPAPESVPPPPSLEEQGTMTLTVVFDNYAGQSQYRTGWGFACVVQLTGATILFDTGADGDVLTSNMRAAGIAPGGIDMVVLSHIHGDHTGGLDGIVALTPGVTVYAPPCFPEGFGNEVRRRGAEFVEVSPGQRLAEHVLTTGEVDGPVDEQALVLETAQGLVVITGCAHPGVDSMVAAAKQRCGGDVSLVLGGFHLTGASRTHIQEVARSLQAMGVERAGPCHCSGETARRVFAELFGQGYVDVHAGTRLQMALPADE